jgi:hypothetical protein
MNREQRRHPEKQQNVNPQKEQDLHSPTRPPEEESVRAKSSRHKKSTADKWNQ